MANAGGFHFRAQHKTQTAEAVGGGCSHDPARCSAARTARHSSRCIAAKRPARQHMRRRGPQQPTHTAQHTTAPRRRRRRRVENCAGRSCTANPPSSVSLYQPAIAPSLLPGASVTSCLDYPDLFPSRESYFGRRGSLLLPLSTPPPPHSLPPSH